MVRNSNDTEQGQACPTVMQADETQIKKLASLIKKVQFCMLTTMDEKGHLHSRPMAVQNSEFDGTLWFFTEADSRKVHEAEREHQVNVAFANPDDNEYVSLCGVALLVRDKEKAKELWSAPMKAWFPKGLDDPNLALLMVSVEGAEYWDSPASAVVQVAGFVKAVVTGQRANPGENRRLRLE